MRYSEDTLQSWTQPLSKTEEDRVENTAKMIKSAIDLDERLKNMKIEVFAQGSYANNTNVKSESDIDICVMLKDTFHTKYPEGKTDKDYGFSKSSLTYGDYRNMVKKAMQNKFGSQYVNEGNKSIKINENSYHVQADVVPSLQFRNYRYANSFDPNQFVEGIWFIALDGTEVVNYPKKHIENGKSKNISTDGYYKKAVRIMKHIKNDMAGDGVANDNTISSFLIESLVYNVPNEVFTVYSSWNITIRKIIYYLYEGICNQKYKEWTEVSRMFYLFHNERKWNVDDVKQWLATAWDYLGYGD